MRAGDHPVRLAGRALGERRHICALLSGAAEEQRVLRAFLQEGLDGGEKGLQIVDPDLRGDHLKRLAEAGIDVDRALATGQLEVRSWHEAYLREGRFEQDAMLALVDEILQSSAAAGYPRTRVLAHMEWALRDAPGVDDLLEYETRVNYVLNRYPDPVICAYDLSKFGGDIAIDVMRTHPAVLIGGVVNTNPFFVPPQQFLLEIRERRSTRRSTRLAG